MAAQSKGTVRREQSQASFFFFFFFKVTQGKATLGKETPSWDFSI